MGDRFEPDVQQLLGIREIQLRQAMAMAAMGTWEWHVLEDQVTWSPELRRILGVGDMPGTARNFMALVHPEDRPWAESSTRDSLRTGTTSATPFRIVRPDGCVRVLKGSAVTARFEDGKPVYMVGILQDLGGEVDCPLPLRDRAALESLSPRERQVLEHVVRGGTSKAIALALGLSPKTVETYRSRVMTKLGIEDLVSLVRFCIRHGVTVL